MADNDTLVVVESPAKAKTIGKYLGKGYTVKATVGHIRDLPERELGVDVEKDFKPKFVTVKGKAKAIQELKKASKEASLVLIATDPDREGEAIAWHVRQQLGAEHVRRVLFHEITKDAIRNAVSHTTQHRREEGRGPAGAAHPRPAGRLQGEPAPLEVHEDGALGGPRADGGPAPDRGARGGDREVRGAGVLVRHRAVREGGPGVRRGAAQARRQEARDPHRRPRPARWSRRRATPRSSSPTSSARSGASTRPRRSPPARCSRRPPSGSASRPSGR